MQKLTDEEIKAFANEEKDPEKIIELITKNNANFDKRTEFSKQKYLEKKNKKYNLIIKIDMCSIRNLNQYFVKDKREYIFPREDFIAYVLNHVHAEDRENVFLFEKSRGLLLAGLVEKIKDFDLSKIMLYHPKMDCVDVGKYESIKYLELGHLIKNKVICVNNSNLCEIKEKINFVVLACDENETFLLDKIEPNLAFNAKVIIFSNFYESATRVYEHLITKKIYANMLLHDYFYREIQAWPMRSHPTMSGNTSSGYIVTGIRINPVENMQ